MTTSETLYRTPSHPYRWVGLLALSQAAVALLWWHRGWGWGLLALLLSHALFVVPVF
ncbi:polysaccharide deacetylase family protein, partial [Xanthomonas oryzae pv. oryzae]